MNIRLNTPKVKLNFITLDISHKSIINYKVDKKSLSITLPSWLKPLAIEDDPEKMLISSSVYNVRGAGWLMWLSYIQNSYRTYVWDRINRCYAVWYFKMFVNTLWYPVPKWMSLPVGLTKMEMKRDRYTIQWNQIWLKNNSKGGCLTLRNTGKKMPLYTGFKDITTQKELLAHPVRGYFLCTDGRIGGFDMQHNIPECFDARSESDYFPWFENHNIANPAQMNVPHSAIYIPEGRVYMSRPGKYPFLRYG